MTIGHRKVSYVTALTQSTLIPNQKQHTEELRRFFKYFTFGLRFVGVRLHKTDHFLRQLKSTLMALFYLCLGLYLLLVDIRIVIEKHEIEDTVTPTGIMFIMWNIQTLISQERLRSQRIIKAIYSTIVLLIPIYLIFLIVTKFFINITYAYTGSDRVYMDGALVLIRSFSSYLNGSTQSVSMHYYMCFTNALYWEGKTYNWMLKKVYSFLMLCTNVPTFMFLFIRLLSRERWGDILHAIPGAIIYTYTYLGLTVVPARMQGELYKAKPILCANEAIWVPYDPEVNRLARTLAIHFDQPDLGISLWGFALVSKPFILTTISVMLTLLALFLEFKRKTHVNEEIGNQTNGTNPFI